MLEMLKHMEVTLMETNSIKEAVLCSVLALSLVSPGLFLLCLCSKWWDYVVAIILFIVALTGAMGLEHIDLRKPQVTNNLYNYGEAP